MKHYSLADLKEALLYLDALRIKANWINGTSAFNRLHHEAKRQAIENEIKARTEAICEPKH